MDKKKIKKVLDLEHSFYFVVSFLLSILTITSLVYAWIDINVHILMIGLLSFFFAYLGSRRAIYLTKLMETIK